jgi:hypothetical protein
MTTRGATIDLEISLSVNSLGKVDQFECITDSPASLYIASLPISLSNII